MNISDKLARFLKGHKVKYELFEHPRAFTACEIAMEGHIPGSEFLKTVMVKMEGRNIMLVLPSDRTVDLFKLSFVLGTRDLYVEQEPEFREMFADCEPGAMPPFGALYNIPCYLDESIKGETVSFNAGSHAVCVRMKTEDFLRLSKECICDFSVPGKKVAV